VNAYEFVLGIIVVVFAFSIIKHRLGIPSRSMREMRGDPPVNDAENARLKGQVHQLQDRIKVLERIVTDRGAQTAEQIDALRDRDRIQEADKD